MTLAIKLFVSFFVFLNIKYKILIECHSQCYFSVSYQSNWLAYKLVMLLSRI